MNCHVTKMSCREDLCWGLAESSPRRSLNAVSLSFLMPLTGISRGFRSSWSKAPTENGRIGSSPLPNNLLSFSHILSFLLMYLKMNKSERKLEGNPKAGTTCFYGYRYFFNERTASQIFQTIFPIRLTPSPQPDISL